MVHVPVPRPLPESERETVRKSVPDRTLPAPDEGGPTKARSPTEDTEPGVAPSEAETRYFDVRHLDPDRICGVLVAIDGELSGAVLRLTPGNNTLGREPGCDVVLDSVEVSGRHASIVHRASTDSFTIEALSERPVLVNRQQVDRSDLNDGDLVKLGATSLRFRTIEDL